MTYNLFDTIQWMLRILLTVSKEVSQPLERVGVSSNPSVSGGNEITAENAENAKKKHGCGR